MRNLWIATSRILYCFDVAYAGECEFDPFKTDFVFSPPAVAPFPAKVTVRSENHAKLIERTFMEYQMAEAKL